MNEPVVSVQSAFAWQLCMLSEHSLTDEQESPLPVYPALQTQPKEPTVLAHCALASQWDRPSVHSFASSHTTPLPVKPSVHEQVNELAVLMQTERPTAQLSNWPHAMNVQESPLPVYPLLHAHVNEPALSVHAASAWQLCVPSVHSLLLEHETPDPV